MKRLISVLLLSALAVACESNDVAETNAQSKKEPFNYLDLTGDDSKDLINEYWIVKRRVEPRYPSEAARDRVSGCVDMTLGIDSEGKLMGVKVIKSYPDGVFDNYAVAALSKWKWVPTAANNDRMPVLTNVKMDFMVELNRNSKEFVKHCGSFDT